MSAPGPPPRQPRPELRPMDASSRLGLARQAAEGIAVVVAAAVVMIVVGWVMATIVAWLA